MQQKHRRMLIEISILMNSIPVSNRDNGALITANHDYMKINKLASEAIKAFALGNTSPIGSSDPIKKEFEKKYLELKEYVTNRRNDNWESIHEIILTKNLFE